MSKIYIIEKYSGGFQTPSTEFIVSSKRKVNKFLSNEKIIFAVDKKCDKKYYDKKEWSKIGFEYTLFVFKGGNYRIKEKEVF